MPWLRGIMHDGPSSPASEPAWKVPRAQQLAPPSDGPPPMPQPAIALISWMLDLDLFLV